MRYSTCLERLSSLPVVESRTLTALGARPQGLSVQLSRWVRQGKLIGLRRGFFLLPESLRRVEPPPDYLANVMAIPSYVSLERALWLHGVIPERVPLVQSVTTGRPRRWSTPVGDFQYHHVKTDWFMGYVEIPVPGGRAMVALPEKALLDRVRLSAGPWTGDRIRELRLQEVERLDPARLLRLAAGHGERLERAAAALARWIRR